MLKAKVLDFICQKVLEIKCHFLLESTCRLHAIIYLILWIVINICPGIIKWIFFRNILQENICASEKRKARKVLIFLAF